MEMLKVILQTDLGSKYPWLLAVLVAMGLDMATGFIQAIINHDVASSKMSIGLLKKAAILLVLVGSIPLTMLFGPSTAIPILVVTYGISILNEFVSIMENLKKMGVNTEFLQPVFNLLKQVTKEDNENGKSN